MNDYPEWVLQYMRLRFTPNGRMRDTGVDCYGLVRLILMEQCGFSLPAYDLHYDGQDSDQVCGAHVQHVVSQPEWRQVSTPRQFDVALLMGPGGNASHCGLYCTTSRIIHITKHTGVVVERANAMKASGPVMGHIRYEAR